jgi:hypothetical protein
VIAYHIDRLNKLKPGMTIKLENINVNPTVLKDIIDQRYPEGLSAHGEKYYAQQANRDTLQDILTENIYEYERKLYYPHKPSRLQSFFASETMDEAMLWVSKIGLMNYTIWEVEFDDDQFVKLDASWLGVDKDNLSFLVAAHFAGKYWRGESNSMPEWELLVKAPIKILSAVKSP